MGEIDSKRKFKDYVLKQVGESKAINDYERLTESRAKQIARFATVTEFNHVDLIFEIVFDDVPIMRDMEQDEVFSYIHFLIEEIDEYDDMYNDL